MAKIVDNNIGNVLAGGAGSDWIFGNGGDDVLNGSGGNDRLNGGIDNDTINGGTGIDTADYSSGILLDGNVFRSFTGATGGVRVDLNNLGFQNTGGSGWDKLSSIENLTGSNSNDILTGNAGPNVLSGLAGNDILTGGAGNDTLDGGTGNDTASYVGAAGAVAVNLNFAAQTTVGAGNDTLSGIENITGTNFSGDYLVGNGSGNVLMGLNGDDSLIGNGGNDTLSAGSGKDLLDGGAGRDSLSGGLGNDRFDYNATTDSLAGVLNRDVISGFTGNNLLVGDRIDLHDIDAKVGLPGNQDFTFLGNAAFPIPFTGQGQLRFNTTTQMLEGNTDANLVSVELQIHLVGVPSLSVGGVGTDIIL